MSILAVYSDSTKRYIDFFSSKLEEAGFSVIKMNYTEANNTYSLNISSTPVFYIIKSEIPSYSIGGIQNLDTVINWAKESNIL